MLLLRILILIILLTSAAGTAFSQLNLPGYLPSVCASAAKNAVAGATDGQIVAIAAVGIDVDLGITQMFIGMNLTDGKSPMWMYLIYSATLDTAIWVPLIRPLGSCTSPPVDVPTDGVDISQIGTTPIPANSVEGVNVVNAVKANSEYQKFNAKHPDSLQFISLLAVSTEEFLSFPAGTPYWLLGWMDYANPTGTPFFCAVHAENGQTVCFGGDVNSVGESNSPTFTPAWPNPAVDVATITVPPTALGKPLTIQAISPTGESLELLNGVYPLGEFLLVPTHELSNGVWYVRVLGADQSTQHATTQIIIQR